MREQMESTRPRAGWILLLGVLTLSCASLGQHPPVHSGWDALPSVLARIVPPTFPQRAFDITAFGAVGDGTTDCTGPFAKAIDACHAEGGGRVLVPAGVWSTGAIRLKSNVELHLTAGATVRFSTDPSKYLPLVRVRWEGVECMNYSPLIYAYGEENIAVTGEGILDGQGPAGWWAWSGKIPGSPGPDQKKGRARLMEMGERGVKVEERVFGEGWYLRPNFFVPYNCRNVLVSGVTFTDSPMWFIHPVLCTNVSVTGVTVSGQGPNNDGCDPESSTDVLIRGCFFDTGDDCIAIKSGRNNDGRRVNVPSANIVIQKCAMRNGHGGVVIGSEASGSVRNVFAEECRMDSPKLERALRIKTNAVRGGVIENVFMRRVEVGEVSEAVVKIDYYYEEGEKGDHLPVVRNIDVRDVTCEKSRFAIWIRAFRQSPAERIRIEDCVFSGVGEPNVLENVREMSQKNVVIRMREQGDVSRASWPERIAESFLARHPDSVSYAAEKSYKWHYEVGVMLEGMRRMWERTGDRRYLEYIRTNVDRFVGADGSISTYEFETFNLDNIPIGRQLLLLAGVTGDPRYRKAADLLRRQLTEQPRTPSGGFWHKAIYPNQMWLDGLYMAEPFYARYALEAGDTAALSDVVRQFVLMERMARDEQSGLLYHAWDESRSQKWADPATGRSPHFWGRAMGWYGMGLVDVLEILPPDHPGRGELVGILRRLAEGLLRHRDPDSKLWYQVVDQGGRQGNYLEASASAMYVYVFARGAARGYLPARFRNAAQESFDGIIKQLVTVDDRGRVSLNDVCSVAGLGGKPYRDGSFEYYVSEPRRVNDFKGYGPFLFAALELEEKRGATADRKKTVLLDCFYNNEWRPDPKGVLQRYHYVWHDTTNSGFSILARRIAAMGAGTDTLCGPPTAAGLARGSVYVIVDPDTPAETLRPNVLESEAIEAIRGWVEGGGVLLLLGNDRGNAEFEHWNRLAGQFGIRFIEESANRVVKNQYATGAFDSLPEHPVFRGVRKIFMKEISTLELREPARPLLTSGGRTIIASARYGRGLVVAVGDPWLYDEYMDSRRLPVGYDNSLAGENLFRWLLSASVSTEWR